MKTFNHYDPKEDTILPQLNGEMEMIIYMIIGTLLREDGMGEGQSDEMEVPRVILDEVDDYDVKSIQDAVIKVQEAGMREDECRFEVEQSNSGLIKIKKVSLI